jgi:hypothetical protein
MELVSTNSLHGSRAYLTVFDRITYSQVAWSPQDVADLQRSLERQLKFIILIKGHVVIAASHLLESELAHEILLPHPRLFTESIVVPALRSEFQSFEQFLDAKLAEVRGASEYDGAKKRDVAKMLDQMVSLAARWEVDKTSSWFQQRMVADLKDESSLLRSCLRQNRVIASPDLAKQIAAVPRLGRNDVYRIAKSTQDKGLWELLANYADFIYYLSGAKAVDSEGVLPQENLMDFSLSDMAGGKTHLSDMEVFFKMFVDIVKAATHAHFPIEVLDVLCVEDVLDLHHVAVNEDFTEKYNMIQAKTKEGLVLRDPERLVMLMQELEQYENDLHTQYQRAIDAELPGYFRDMKVSSVGKLLHAVASLLIPWYGAPESTKNIVVSGLDLGGRRQLATAIEQRVSRCLDTCRKLTDRRGSEAHPVLLRFMQHIGRKYAKTLIGS